MKKLFIIIIGMAVLLGIGWFSFPNLIYNYFPRTYYEYQERADFDPNYESSIIEILDPPIGGCFNSCSGVESIISCEKYTRKYDRCLMKCVGYHHNNCGE